MEGFDGTFEAGGWVFRPTVANDAPADPEAISVFKAMHMVELLASHLRTEGVERIVELGTMSGGSTALLAAVAPRASILTIELEDRPVPQLQRFLATDPAPDRVRSVTGVDQGDQGTLRRLVGETFGDEPVDLVIDDASHELERTRASFDALAPSVRPGGCYLIEDWSWAHLRVDPAMTDPRLRWPSGPSMGALVYELVMAVACASEVIHRVDLDYSIVRAWRGPATPDPEGFRLRDLLRGVEPYPPPGDDGAPGVRDA